MARKLSDKALAYVKKEAIDGTTGATIYRALVNGEVEELGPIEVSQRRVQQLATDFKREHSQENPEVDPASLPEAMNTERAMILAEVRRRRIKASRLPDSSVKAIDLLGACARFLNTFERSLSTGKTSQQAEAGATPEGKSTLDLLGETMEPASERPTLPSAPSTTTPDLPRDTTAGPSQRTVNGSVSEEADPLAA